MSSSLVRGTRVTSRQSGCRFGVINNRRPKTATTQVRKVPTLPFSIDLLNKFEGNKEETALISTLREETTLATPRSIKEFIDKNSIESVREQSALVIQRNWRSFRRRKRLYNMFLFFKKIRQVKYAHAFSAWKLALMPPADIARHYFDKFLSFHELSGILPIQTYFLQKTNFNTYMKTNFLLMKPSFDHNRITKIVCGFNKPLIETFFKAWLQFTQEQVTLKHSHMSVYNVGRNRMQFGNMYWAYHVWKRWASLHRAHKRGIYPNPNRFFYIPEWSFVLANKKKQKRLEANANIAFKRFLILRVKKALRNNALMKMTIHQNMHDIQNKVNKIIMSKAYRAFMTLTAEYKLKAGIQLRALKYWYTYVDKTRMLRMFKDIHSQRTVLFSLNKAFRQWRLNIVEAGAYIAMMHDVIYNARARLIRWVFLMMGDTVHFTFYSAFVLWRKIIVAKQKTRKFMEWSRYHSRRDTIRKYIFDCFKVKANFTVDRTNGSPFGGRAPQLKKRNRIQAIDSPTNFISTTLHAYKDVIQYPMCEEDLTEWEPNEVKSLWIQLIFLLATQKPSDISTTDPKQRANDVKNYRIKNMLFNQAGLSEHKSKQNEQDMKIKAEWRERLRRDAIMILSMEAHDEAIAYNKIDPRFGLHDGPLMYSDRFKKVEEEEEEEEEEEGLESISFNFNNSRGMRSRRHSVRPVTEPIHPLMQEISAIRRAVLENVRRFRRSPGDIFVEKISKRTMNSRALSQASTNLSLSRQSSTYDSFIPIGSLSNSSFNSSASFKLQGIGEALEISNIQKSFHEIQKLPQKIIPAGSDDINTKLGKQNLSVGQIPKKIHFGRKEPEQKSQEMEIIKEEVSDEEQEEEYMDTPMPTPVKEKKPEEKEETIKNLTPTKKKEAISLEDLAFNFLNDTDFSNESTGDYGVLTNKYVGILAALLGFKGHVPVPQIGGKPVQNIKTEFPAVSTKISRMVRKINAAEPSGGIRHSGSKNNNESAKFPQIKERKRAKLFEERGENSFEEVVGQDGRIYKKSNCPEFAGALFIGEQVLTLAPWEKRTESRKSAAESARSSYSALPSATITVKGFEDLPGLSELAKEVAGFLAGNTEGEESSIYKDQGEIGPDGELIRILKSALEIADGVAKKMMIKEVIDTPDDEVYNFVDIAGVVLNTDKKGKVIQNNPRSEDEVSESYTSTMNATKHRAFGTSSRKQESGIIIMEDRLTFTNELLRAIKEGSKMMKPHVMKYYGSIDNIDPFKELSDLRTRLKKRQKQVNQGHLSVNKRVSRIENSMKPRPVDNSRQREIERTINNSRIKVTKKISEAENPPNTSRRNYKEVEEVEVGGGEVALTIGGRQSRTETHKTRPSTAFAPSHLTASKAKTVLAGDLVVAGQRAKTAMQRESSGDLFIGSKPTIKRESSGDLCLTARKTMPQLSVATLDTTKMSIRVHETSGRPKPRVTKMTPTQPKNPDTLIYEMPRPKTAPIVSDKTYKVEMEREEIVTDADIDFMMFITPYIIPPELLNKLLAEAEKLESQTIKTARTLPR